MKILADASLPGLEEAFPEPFCITLYNHVDEIEHLLPQQDILLCRANIKVNAALLKKHQLRYVATASSGTDHVDKSWLQSQNIQLIDAKGCNASSVADYVMAQVAYLEHHHLIPGKKAGVIGIGKVGSLVAARLQAAGYEVLVYDPLKAIQDQLFASCSLEELHTVDLLCIHAELHDTLPHPSINLINAPFLQQLKTGTVLINAARGGIVDEQELLKHPQLVYCTDVYFNEPFINENIVAKATLCTPHIAGHSLEAKYKAVEMISTVLHSMMKLPYPYYVKPHLNLIAGLEQNTTWQEKILRIYNPLEETLQLKQAKDKNAAFLELRKAHHKRHEFVLYTDTIADIPTRLILGAQAAS